jgi:acyl dehydratase
MPEDLSYDAIELGKQYGPYYYPLQDRVARTLEATENEHPWHRARSPWGPPVAPPSIVGNICMRFIDWIAPVPPGTLHVKQEIETQAALRLDRHPLGYGKFVEKYERRGRRWAVFEARFRDETGLLIGHGRTTICFPGTVETKDEPRKEHAQIDRKGELTPITRTITQEKITAFSEDSYNAQNARSIHLHPVIAKEHGYEKTVAQGAMVADYMSELMTNVFQKEWFEYADLSVVFLHPVLDGDTITANGALKEAETQGAVVRKVYHVWAENQAGDAVAVGTASSLVRPD